MKDLQKMSEIELLQTHGAVIDELLNRGVVRTRNNPVGDFTEWLVCQRLGLEMQGSSNSGFDAVDEDGVRYQIKGRQDERTSVQFSAIRNLHERGFDFIVAVAFKRDFSIRFAVQIPYELVPQIARYQSHTNAHILNLTDGIVELYGVADIGKYFQCTPPVQVMPTVATHANFASKSRGESLSSRRSRSGNDWPNSISIRKNLIGSGIIRQFEFNGIRYEVPHDELVQIVNEVTRWLQSPSWTDGGGYSTSNPSKALLAKLRSFALNAGN